MNVDFSPANLRVFAKKDIMKYNNISLPVKAKIYVVWKLIHPETLPDTTHTKICSHVAKLIISDPALRWEQSAQSQLFLTKSKKL